MPKRIYQHNKGKILRMKRHAVVQPLSQPYRLIPLTQGHNAIVDVDDFERLSQWNWAVIKGTRSLTNYAYRSEGHGGRKIFMHRIVLGLKDAELADHINKNGLDNRKCNLRKATVSQNCQNRRTPKNNTSGFKGVSRIRKT